MPTVRPFAPQIARQVLHRGGTVAYPTETVWGLAALPRFAAELYRRKGRDSGKPLQLSCANADAALALAQPTPALSVLSRCWPGPLTVITAAQPAALADWGDAAALVAPGGQVGLRVPAHPAAQTLLTDLGPLATTSLNPSGEAPALNFAQATAYGLADFVWPTDARSTDGDAAPDAAPSTVLRLPQNGGPAQVLRVGGVSAVRLRGLLEPLGLEVQLWPEQA